MGVVRRYSNIWRKEYGDKPVPWKLRISSPPSSGSENSIKLNSDIISQVEPDVKEKIGAIVSSMRNLIKNI